MTVITNFGRKRVLQWLERLPQTSNHPLKMDSFCALSCIGLRGTKNIGCFHQDVSCH